MSTSIRTILFDFDDTLFLKKKRIFIPRIGTILQELQTRHIQCIVVTCNHKAVEIMKQHQFDHLFHDIIHVNARSEYKSDVINHRVLAHHDPKTMLFFDNDPFHIYDVSSRCDIRSFLVDPDHGISERVLFMLTDSMMLDLRRYCNRGLQEASSNRYISLQNLMEMDKMK